MVLETLMFAALLQNPGNGPETFRNPVWNRNFPDPFIVQDGEDFYAYATQNSRAGFQILHSKNLVDWMHLGGVNFPEWSNGQLWAPEVYRWKGKWIMLFSARDKTSGKRDLGISESTSPRGPFRFVAKLVLGTDENSGTTDNGAIDGTLIVDKGRPYLFYIREAPPRAIKMVRLSDDLKSTVGESKVVLKVDRPIEQGILDAPTVVHERGKYWLFYSSGWFQSNKADAKYRVWAARADKLEGPYVKPDSPVLAGKEGETYSPGHQCLIQLASGEWWMGYHAWNAVGQPRYKENPVGRTFRLDRLIWTKDGPQCLGPTLGDQAAPKVRG